METASAPLVSVLVPLYNHEGLVARCLDSIVEDPYPRKEILVLDDGSTDGSAEAVRRWMAAKRPRFDGRFEFLSRPNQGLGRTLNELVLRAQGDYVAFVASDDYLLPGGIRARLDYLLRHPGKMAVFADCIVVDGEGRPLHASGIEGLHPGRKRHLLDERLLPYELVLRWCVPGPVFMARRDVYRVVGGYDEDLVVEDWDFYLRLASAGLLGFVDVPVAAYRLYEGNTLHRTDFKERYLGSLLVTANRNAIRFRGIRRLYFRAIRITVSGLLIKRRHRLFGWMTNRLGMVLETAIRLLYDIRTALKTQDRDARKKSLPTPGRS